MEFLYKLYSNNYFGIGLFIVITVLAFSFLIILFFGKKDEKARNTEMMNNVEENAKMLNSLEEKKEVPPINQSLEKEEQRVEEIPLEPMSIQEEDLGTISLTNNNEDIKQIDIEEYTPNEMYDTLERKENLPEDESTLYKEYSSQEEPTVFERSILEEPEYNIPLYEEKEESIEDVLNKYEAVEENIPIVEEPLENNKRDVQSENDLHIFPSAEDLGKEEPIKKTPSSSIFSSVYLNSEEKNNQEDAKKESIPRRTITPTRPQFELPKMADLPKRNNNMEQSPESIINKTAIESKEEKTTVFGNVEEDSYWLDK